MASFWDEIQKQYENAEARYRDNLNVGINMLNNKANQIQQSYANAIGEATQRAGLFAQSLNLPAQFAQMLANREDAQEARRIQESQFDRSLALSRDEFNQTVKMNDAEMKYMNASLGIQRQQQEISRMLANNEIDKFDYEKKLRELEKQQASADAQFSRDQMFTDYPQAQQIYKDLEKKYPNATVVQKTNWLNQLGTQGKLVKDNPSMWDKFVASQKEFFGIE